MTESVRRASIFSHVVFILLSKTCLKFDSLRICNTRVHFTRTSETWRTHLTTTINCSRFAAVLVLINSQSTLETTSSFPKWHDTVARCFVYFWKMFSSATKKNITAISFIFFSTHLDFRISEVPRVVYGVFAVVEGLEELLPRAERQAQLGHVVFCQQHERVQVDLFLVEHFYPVE